METETKIVRSDVWKYLEDGYCYKENIEIEKERTTNYEKTYSKFVPFKKKKKT